MTEAAAAEAALAQGHGQVVPSSDGQRQAAGNLAVLLEDQLLARHGGLPSTFEPLLYMPTQPRLRVVSVVMDSGRAMQSAAKCPFLLQFKVTPYAGPLLEEGGA